MRKFVINSLYIWPPHLYTVATLPCEIKKLIFNSIIHAYFRLFTLSYLCYLRRKQTVTLLPTTPKNVTALPYKMHNFFIWLKVGLCWIPPNFGGCEKSRLWVGIGGSEKNRLWCVANGMSGKQRYSKCSKDHLQHGYMLPVFFATDQLYHPPCSAEIQTVPYRGLVLDTR